MLTRVEGFDRTDGSATELRLACGHRARIEGWDLADDEGEAVRRAEAAVRRAFWECHECPDPEPGARVVWRTCERCNTPMDARDARHGPTGWQCPACMIEDAPARW